MLVKGAPGDINLNTMTIHFLFKRIQKQMFDVTVWIYNMFTFAKQTEKIAYQQFIIWNTVGTDD